MYCHYDILLLDDGKGAGVCIELFTILDVRSIIFSTSIGTIIVEDGLHVPVGFAVTYFDAALGNSVNATNITTPITNLEYENEIQDAKRNIYVLKQEYLSVIFNDLEEIMEYKKGSTQYVNETLKIAENIRLYSN